MIVSQSRQFVRDWGLLIFLVVASYWLFTMHRAGQQILEAKERLFQERESIVQTRKSVGNIERQLQINDVPNRLGRIESSITTAVSQNQQSIDKLDANQKRLVEKQTKMVGSLSHLLEVPKDVIDGTKPLEDEPVVPPDRIEIKPGVVP